MPWTRTMRPSPQGSTVRSAPASASIPSVWDARVVTASRTTVVPWADSPAREGWPTSLGRLEPPWCPVDAVQGRRPGQRNGGWQRGLRGPPTVAPMRPQRLGHPVHRPRGRASRHPPARSPSRTRQPGPPATAWTFQSSRSREERTGQWRRDRPPWIARRSRGSRCSHSQAPGSPAPPPREAVTSAPSESP